MVFSLEETWFAVGANFGNYFEKGTDSGDFYVGSLVINLSVYEFYNQRNIGMFSNCGVLFPVINTIENNYNRGVQGDFIIGPGFRHNINDKLKLHYGIGLDMHLLFLLARANDDEKSSDQRIGLGIGGDIGLKYDLTDIIYINIGTTLSYNFAAYRWGETTVDNWTNTQKYSSGWADGYTMIGIRPYIVIGFNYYQERGKWGKPK
jgi:hypothetical protein